MPSFLEILLLVALFLLQKKIMDSIAQKHAVTQEPEKSVHVVHMNFEVEKINNIYYAWKDGTEFVGQSKTQEELEEIINQYIETNSKLFLQNRSHNARNTL